MVAHWANFPFKIMLETILGQLSHQTSCLHQQNFSSSKWSKKMHLPVKCEHKFSYVSILGLSLIVTWAATTAQWARSIKARHLIQWFTCARRPLTDWKFLGLAIFVLHLACCLELEANLFVTVSVNLGNVWDINNVPLHVGKVVVTIVTALTPLRIVQVHPCIIIWKERHVNTNTCTNKQTISYPLRSLMIVFSSHICTHSCTVAQCLYDTGMSTSRYEIFSQSPSAAQRYFLTKRGPTIVLHASVPEFWL